MKTIHDCQILQKMLPLNFTRPDDPVNQRCISDRRHFMPYAMKFPNQQIWKEKLNWTPWFVDDWINLWANKALGYQKLFEKQILPVNWKPSKICSFHGKASAVIWCILWKWNCRCTLAPQLLPCTLHSGEKSNCCTILINSCHAEWLQPKNVANNLIHYPLSQIWVQLIPTQCLKRK